MDSGNIEAWDSREAVLRLIEHTEALKALYQALGYSPVVERQARGLVAEIASWLQAEIPEPAAFRRAVAETRRQLEAYRRGEAAIDPLWMADPDLFGAMFEARDDLQRVIALLKEDPLWKTLPYEIESSLLRRRPADPGRFASWLDELERLFITVPWAPRGQDARQAVLDAIAEIRRGLAEDGSLLFSLQTLACRVEVAAASLSYDAAAQAKKRQLDELLWNLAHFQHAYPPGHPLLQTIVEEHAQRYLDAAWMHKPWLTAYLLARPLDGELAVRASVARRYMWLAGGAAAAMGLLYVLDLGLLFWISAVYLTGCLLRLFGDLEKSRLLRLTRDEVACGQFDGEAIARRLRRQEEAKGLSVGGLFYALLRVNTSHSQSNGQACCPPRQ